MMDLAAFRMRDTVLGFGDMRRALRPVREARGRSRSTSTPIMHHHFAFTLSNQLAFHAALAEPPRRDRLHDEHAVGQRDEPLRASRRSPRSSASTRSTPSMCPSRGDPRSPRPHEHLVRSLRSLDLADEYERHQLRIAFRLARHLQRFDEIGDECTEADLDDLQGMLGRRPSTWQEGDAALEAFVLADDGAHDEELLQLFHRRYLRYKLLVRPRGFGDGDAPPDPEVLGLDAARAGSCRVLTDSTPRSHAAGAGWNHSPPTEPRPA